LFFNAVEPTPTSVANKGIGTALNDLIGGQLRFHVRPDVFPTFKAAMIKRSSPSPPGNARGPAESPAASEAAARPCHHGVVGMYAPRGTPQPMIAKLAAALYEPLKDSDVKSRLASAGAEAISSDCAESEALPILLKSEN